ncbi:hypothetical protein ABU178_02920 [Pantoea osteomyelitidis]|uniref:Uncharacterized protein n=1 Tax=Pantoea osteomyelitidis TaxID=3230026 RepID=A0ABW7PS59_9GAMM
MRELHEVETMEVAGGVSFADAMDTIKAGIDGLKSWMKKEDGAPSASDALMTIGAGIGGIIGSITESISKWFRK